MIEFKSLSDCQDYLRSNSLNKGFFFYNVYGWEYYFTLEPTSFTPTGKKKGFPRQVEITLRSKNIRKLKVIHPDF
jgi:hypothetical protein